jgi:hypothetical protein
MASVDAFSVWTVSHHITEKLTKRLPTKESACPAQIIGKRRFHLSTRYVIIAALPLDRNASL